MKFRQYFESISDDIENENFGIRIVGEIFTKIFESMRSMNPDEYATSRILDHYPTDIDRNVIKNEYDAFKSERRSLDLLIDEIGGIDKIVDLFVDYFREYSLNKKLDLYFNAFAGIAHDFYNTTQLFSQLREPSYWFWRVEKQQISWTRDLEEQKEFKGQEQNYSNIFRITIIKFTKELERRAKEEEIPLSDYEVLLKHERNIFVYHPLSKEMQEKLVSHDRMLSAYIPNLDPELAKKYGFVKNLKKSGLFR